MSISGILRVRQCSAGGKKSHGSSVSVFSDCEEAFGPRRSSWDTFLPAACRNPSVSAVLIQTASLQLHQVKYFLLLFTEWGCRDDGLLTLVSCVALRPLTVSTEEYGKMWLAFSHDTKQNLKLMGEDHESLTVTLNILTEKLRLHVVEIIGECLDVEVILVLFVTHS